MIDNDDIDYKFSLSSGPPRNQHPLILNSNFTKHHAMLLRTEIGKNFENISYVTLPSPPFVVLISVNYLL